MSAEQLLFDLGHRASLDAHDFLPAACNREALAWLDRHPQWPAPALVLFGPEGCGKSHLARIFAARSGALALDPGALPCELPPGSAWILDPVTLPLRDEVGLLRVYNGLREAGGHVLLTARLPPAAWSIGLPDLASRLRAAPTVEIGSPDDALLAAVLVKLLADRQLRIAGEVIPYLVSRMERSFAAAHRIVRELDERSLRRKRPITVALARDALGATVHDQN